MYKISCLLKYVLKYLFLSCSCLKLQINGAYFEFNKQFKVSQSPLAQWLLLNTGLPFIYILGVLQ